MDRIYKILGIMPMDLPSRPLRVSGLRPFAVQKEKFGMILSQKCIFVGVNPENRVTCVRCVTRKEGERGKEKEGGKGEMGKWGNG